MPTVDQIVGRDIRQSVIMPDDVERLAGAVYAVECARFDIEPVIWTQLSNERKEVFRRKAKEIFELKLRCPFALRYVIPN